MRPSETITLGCRVVVVEEIFTFVLQLLFLSLSICDLEIEEREKKCGGEAIVELEHHRVGRL